MGFADLIQEGAGKKLIIAGVLFAIAVIILVVTNTGSVSGGSVDVTLKCIECGHVEAVSRNKYEKMEVERISWFIERVAEDDPERAESIRGMLERNIAFGAISPDMPQWGTSDWPFDCPACGEITLCVQSSQLP